MPVFPGSGMPAAAEPAAADHDPEEGDDKDSSSDSEGGDRLSSDEEEAAAAPPENEADADALVRRGLAAGNGSVVKADSVVSSDDGGVLAQPAKPAKAKSGGTSDAQSADESGLGSEAGAHVTNYNAGKRFKKIYRLLMSPQAQRASRVLQLQALGVVALLMVAHTVTFVIMMSHLKVRRASRPHACR
jgi:hypothetical protein